MEHMAVFDTNILIDPRRGSKYDRKHSIAPVNQSNHMDGSHGRGAQTWPRSENRGGNGRI